MKEIPATALADEGNARWTALADEGNALWCLGG